MFLFRFRKAINLSLLILIISISIENAYANQDESDKCYRTNKESVIISPVGLEVDSKENIYIATPYQINVYNNLGDFSYAIRIPTTGTIRMRMLKDEKLGISVIRSNKVYILTSDGYLIDIQEDKDGKINHEYTSSQSKEKVVKGNRYILRNFFGFTKVIKMTPEGVKQTVYQISLWQWLVKILLNTFYFCILPLIVLCIIIRTRRRK